MLCWAVSAWGGVGITFSTVRSQWGNFKDEAMKKMVKKFKQSSYYLHIAWHNIHTQNISTPSVLKLDVRNCLGWGKWRPYDPSKVSWYHHWDAMQYTKGLISDSRWRNSVRCWPGPLLHAEMSSITLYLFLLFFAKRKRQWMSGWERVSNMEKWMANMTAKSLQRDNVHFPYWVVLHPLLRQYCYLQCYFSVSCYHGVTGNSPKGAMESSHPSPLSSQVPVPGKKCTFSIPEAAFLREVRPRVCFH